MRFLALSLGAVGSLGVVALGGRTIAADRTAHTRSAPTVAPAVAAPVASDADRVWYGGTLAPIVVVAHVPEPAPARAVRDCPARGS
jgi:hypothetical protein